MTHARRTAAVVGAAVIAMAAMVGGAYGRTQSHTHPSTASATVAGNAIKNFLDIAAANGDSTPTSITYVTSTSSVAQALLFGAASLSSSGDDLSTAPVVVVQATGHFTVTSGHLAPGIDGQQPAAPTGTILQMIWVPSKSAVSDWGVTATPATLSTLGTASTWTG